MSDNSELIYRLRRAQMATINRTKLDQLLEDAIDALLADERQPGDPFPDWVRDILRNNDGDWAKRLKREQAKVETLRATERDNSRTISDLKANYKRSKEDRERATNFLHHRLVGATEELLALREKLKALSQRDRRTCGADNFDLQAENKALIEENESLIRENEKLREEPMGDMLRKQIDNQRSQLTSLGVTIQNLRKRIREQAMAEPERDRLRLERDRLEIDRESLREDMLATDMENKALREAMHDIATTANRAQQDPS